MLAIEACFLKNQMRDYIPGLIIEFNIFAFQKQLIFQILIFQI